MALETPDHSSKALPVSARVVWFAAFVCLSLVVSLRQLKALLDLSIRDERYTHCILVPFVCFGVVWLTRRRIFLNIYTDLPAGLPVILASAAAYGLGLKYAALPLSAAAVIGFWTGGFVLLFGRKALLAARFPFALLLLFIPPPPSALDPGEQFLQRSSADAAEVLFRLSSTPVFRDGLQFTIPGVTIEVARECSGIRSFIALMIVTAVLGYMFLQSTWSRAAFLLAVIPISIVKNAIRIVTLSWLGSNGSMDFLTGDLHHRGGPVFSLISLALLTPILLGLLRLESRRRPSAAKGLTQ